MPMTVDNVHWFLDLFDELGVNLDSKYLGGVLWDLSRRTKASLRHHSAIL